MASTTATQDEVTPTASTSTLPHSSSKHGSKLFSGLKGMLRRRRSDNLTDDFPPPLPVDAVSTIKRARRQTYVMHQGPSPEVPKPLPILTLSSHHLVVVESDRRDLAGRPLHHYSHLTPIPEYSGGGGESFTSSSSIGTCSSSASSIQSLDYSEDVLDSPGSHWSDDSSDEYDCTAQLCQCNDLTFTNSARLCPACTSQDVPEDEGLIDSDVDSLIDSYLDEDASEYNRERWSEITAESYASSSSSASTHYDPLFSPRSSSTTFTVASPRFNEKFRSETPVDIRDFDMILTSSPPSPHGIRFNRASIDARDSLIAQARLKRNSTGTV